MNSRMFIALWLGTPLMVGAFLGAMIARTWSRWAFVLAIGVILVAALFAWAYLSAGVDYQHRSCSDCGYYLGRWWEPGFVAYVSIIGYVFWTLGASVGAAARMIIRPSKNLL